MFYVCYIMYFTILHHLRLYVCTIVCENPIEKNSSVYSNVRCI